jgi:hypothetical protein
MSIKNLCFVICILAVGFWTLSASAVVLFSDDFNSPTDSLWTINKAPAANAAQQGAAFGFDYSTFGIPPAPGGDGTDTHGMRLRANVPGSDAAPDTSRPPGTASGLSVSPTGKNFGTSYQAQFYAWSNFFGAPNASGLADNANSEGGTNNVMFAVGTSGTVPVVVTGTTTQSLPAGAAMDGIGFATTGDGGISNDFRVFPKSVTPVPGTTAGVYAASSATPQSNADPYYASVMPSVMAPSGQQAIADADFFDNRGLVMGGSTQAGAFGFAWHKVVLTKTGNVVTWSIDDLLIATYDSTSVGPLGGNNIALGVSDVNATTAHFPSLEFTVFDNLTVTSVTAAGVAGDYNGNGVVDMADYVLWRNGGPLQNEVNTVGTVDASDYTAWRAAFGNHAGSGSGLGSAAVPEPASLMLLSLGITCAWVRRAR